VTRHAVNGTQQGDRDVLITLARRLRQIRDEDAVADAAAALDIFVDHLVPELERRGFRRPVTLADRLRPLSPNGERVLGVAGGVLGFLLLVAAIVLVVWQVTS
jgi:hypothetical protein